MRTRVFRRLSLAVAACALAALPSCATNHLMEWSAGNPSIYHQATEDKSPYVRPLGTIVMLPIAVTWDIATAPFQWLWSVYPYGEDLHPDNEID